MDYFIYYIISNIVVFIILAIIGKYSKNAEFKIEGNILALIVFITLGFIPFILITGRIK